MKEVLSKSFWQGVKKTFYEALENPAPEETVAGPSAADDQQVSPPPTASAAPAAREEG